MSSNTVNILNSSIQLNKKKMDLAMQNIANANNKNYSSKSLDTSALILGDKPSGVAITSIITNRNTFLEKQLFKSQSESVAASKISDYHQKFLDKLSKPGTGQGLSDKIVAFYNSIEALTTEGSNAIMRNDLINKAGNFATFVRELSKELQNDRVTFDQEIGRSLLEVNALLKEINHYNSKKLITADNSFDARQLEDNVSAALAKLSNYLDINYIQDSQGRIIVSLRRDGQEIVGRNIYSFSYEPAFSPDQFILNQDLKPILLEATSLDGIRKTSSIFINQGEAGHVSYNLPGGSIAAALEMRDNIIPAMIENLDQLALQFAKNFNALHNKGTGAVALNQYKGSHLVKASDKMIGEGDILINLMDLQGKPIEATAGNPDSRIAPLSLNLSNFANDSVLGSFNVQGLIDAINNHFNKSETNKRLEMDGLKKLNLVVKSGNANQLDFDFDLTAYSKNLTSNDQITVNFSNFNLTDNSGAAIAFTSSGNNSLNINNGTQNRSSQNSGLSFSINSINTGDYPMTFSCDLSTNVNGIVSNATFSFTIEQPSLAELSKLNGISNKIFTPTNITSTDPNIKLVNNNISYPNGLVKASLVDANGQTVTDPTQEGYLVIEALDKRMTLAFDQKLSKITSLENKALKGPLGEAFGLNDLFLIGSQSKNFASFFELNPIIQNKPQAFAFGQLEEYRAGELNITAPALNFGMGSNNTSLASEYLALTKKLVIFDSTKNIDAKFTSLVGYANETISTYNLQSIEKKVTSDLLQDKFETFSNTIQDSLNVDSDNEALMILNYQKHFGLAAKFLNVHNNLLQTLIDAF
jgi:flagellar hook-associated protein FlgK